VPGSVADRGALTSKEGSRRAGEAPEVAPPPEREERDALPGGETGATGGLEKRECLRGDADDEARGAGPPRACGEREEELSGRLRAASGGNKVPLLARRLDPDFV